MNTLPSTKSPRTQILIVDDHPTIRAGLTQSLSQCVDLKVCGFADDLHSAFESLRSHRPNVVIVDLNLKESCGLELIKRIRAADPTIGTLVWSMHDESIFGKRAERAGATAYVSKTQPTEAVVAALRAIVCGESRVGGAPSQDRRKSAKKPASNEAGTIEDISDRELQVLQMMGRQ